MFERIIVMTGLKMVENAAVLLGYTAANGNLQLNARIKAKALVVVNQIYGDLWRVCYGGIADCRATPEMTGNGTVMNRSLRDEAEQNNTAFVPLESVHEEIKLPERAVNDVMIYGVAMMLAQGESDGAQQQVWVNMYNQKRASLSHIEKIVDVLPIVEG